MPSIINISFLPYQEYIATTTTTTTTTTTICNTCYPFIRPNTFYYNNINNSNNNNQDYYQSLTRNSSSTTIDSESYDEQAEEEEGAETRATCGECGKILGPGWNCETCRRSCPYCNRALGVDSNDYCERCFRYCDKHDIIYPIVNSETQEGPKCPQCHEEKD